MTLGLATTGAAAFTPATAPKRADVRMESLADLKTFAKKLNPAVGYWDPLQLAEVRRLPIRETGSLSGSCGATVT